jgi:pentapeptide MXKDX repeat protein
MTVGEMSVSDIIWTTCLIKPNSFADKMAVNEMTEGKMSANKMIVDKMSADNITQDYMSHKNWACSIKLFTAVIYGLLK